MVVASKVRVSLALRVLMYRPLFSIRLAIRETLDVMELTAVVEDH